LAGSGSAALLALVVVACGSRTELSLDDRCAKGGAERRCANECGAGVQICRDGFWQACEVPLATRACSDGCAEGEQSCSEGAWQACVVPLVQQDCSSVCGTGHRTCRDGVFGKCDAPLPKPPQLKATIRDFTAAHPDFEENFGDIIDRDIVRDLLGMDDTPVYAPVSQTRTTTGQLDFDQWFHDSPPINETAPLDLQLSASKEDPGSFEYSNDFFFPIDGQLFGNEGRMHNYHFTLQASTRFQYHGGEVFSFAGDDDMWVFVNRRLAINLGGTHRRTSAKIALDEIAASHGLILGEFYPLHFFFAERHTVSSTFALRTTIADPGSCD
jgi:fibro-slime domain-containing protein